MERYSDRMAGRYDRGAERERYDRDDRDRYDRYDREDRYERDDRDYYDRDRSRRTSRDMSDSGAMEAIEKSNRDQLNKIADYFDDAREDRLESEKNIMRAVDENAQMLSNIAESLKNATGVPVAVPVNNDTEEFFDEPSVDPSAKDEILKVVADNKQLLTLIRQDMITVTQHQAEETSRGQAPSQITDIPDFLLAERAEELTRGLEEHVHSENVKCYRNVQASLQEQNTETVKEFNKSLTGIKIVSILSLVFSIVTMVLLAAFIFGII